MLHVKLNNECFAWPNGTEEICCAPVSSLCWIVAVYKIWFIDESQFDLIIVLLLDKFRKG